MLHIQFIQQFGSCLININNSVYENIKSKTLLRCEVLSINQLAPVHLLILLEEFKRSHFPSLLSYYYVVVSI